MLEADSPVVRRGREPIEGPTLGQFPEHERGEAANLRLSLVEVLAHAEDSVLRPRLHQEVVLDGTVELATTEFVAGDRSERAQRHPTRGPSGQLHGAENSRVRGNVGEVRPVGRGALRLTADAPAVEQGVAPTGKPEVEESGVLDEEGAPLGKECLERAEVDDGRIGLDLPEVGVDGGVQRESGAEPVAQIHADPTAHRRTVEEGIGRVGWSVLEAADDIRAELEAT
jgi:hypothetical protein